MLIPAIRQSGNSVKTISTNYPVNLRFGVSTATPEKPGPKPTPRKRFRFAKCILAASLIGIGGSGLYIKKQIPVIDPAAAAPQNLQGPSYHAKTAQEKQQLLWDRIQSTRYTQLPALDSAGALSGKGLQKLNNLVKIFDSTYMRNTFDLAEDVRPAHEKPFHPFGAVAKVQFVPKKAHPFTGMFQNNAIGLARLSLAMDESIYAPGIGLKLLVDGKPSINIEAVPSLDPQDSRDFFLRTPSNILPVANNAVAKLVNFILTREAGVESAIHLPLDHIALMSPEGKPVKQPVAPYQIEFRPAQVHFDPNNKNDFRVNLSQIPTGSVIYEIWGKESPDSTQFFHIADLKTTSPFLMSQSGDQELNFLHPRFPVKK